SNNDYTLKVTYTYDLNDGVGDQTLVKELAVKTEAKATPDFEITETEKTQTSFKFDITITDVDSVGAIIKIELVHGEDVTNVEDLTTRELTDLLSNNDYTLKVTYTYDLNDGVGDQTLVKELAVKTEAKATPDFEITETEKTQTSFKFDITVTDVDAVGAITKLELIHGEDVTNVEDLTDREFTNLLSNNDYTVKVTYTYDLNDGVGDQTLVKELAVKTEEKVEPTFTLKDVTSDTYTVSGSYDQTNVDNTLIDYTVKLFKGDELVKENTDKEIAFDSLDYYTDYTVKITYTFDVNDGKGVQTKTVEQAVKTHPYIDATNMSVIGTGVVFEGDKIYLQITLSNPCGATVKTVVINGSEYEVNSASTATVLLVEIENKGQFASGDIKLTLESFSFTLDEVDYTAVSQTQCSDTAKTVTQAEIVSIECVDAGLNYSAWVPKAANKEEYKRFLLVTLNGDQFGEIKKISLRIDANDVFNEFELAPEEVQNLGDGRFLITIPDLTDDMLIDPWGVSTVTLVCGNDFIDNYTVSAEAKGFTIINRFMTVSTVEEFLSLNGTDRFQPKYVELTADLDLSDVENFYGIDDFVGVFDGKGHTITNFSIVGKVTDSGLGLFKRFKGQLCNLTLDNSLYLAEFVSDESYGDYFYAGGLVGWFGGGEINNCTVGGDVLISASSADYAGGIVGYASESPFNSTNIRIINCENYAAVNATGASGVGGILGAHCDAYYGYVDALISGCVNHGSIDSYVYAGGIVGVAQHNMTVDECHNYGGVISTGLAGGISGCGGNISYCINHGNVSSIDNEDEFATVAGGIVGSSGGDTVSNCENYGNVSGIDAVGGITGDCNGNISDCVNSGKVSGDGDYIGGIAGISGDVTINDCVNRGDVSGYSVIGGIVGSNITADIKNCQNYANISGVYGVDGICGGQNGTVENCEDHGTVTIIPEGEQ
ncbi:MAG: hypothetical protein IJC64_03530, partial [Clostridia bacterium]|nr:hypothetical protein [Clostridia bacterium]